MIRTLLMLSFLVFTTVGLAGCSGVATPAIGVLLTDVTWDGDVTRGTIGSKEGRACAQSILMLVAQGDASIQAAAKAGGITRISSVDHYSKNMLGILGEYCTIVRGE